MRRWNFIWWFRKSKRRYKAKDDQICKEVFIKERETNVKGDYKEYLELVIILLRVVPESGIIFMSQASMHHAHWISKVMNCLKIWMSMLSLIWNKKSTKVLLMRVFNVNVCLKAWISEPQAPCAPYNGMLLLSHNLNTH